MIWPPHITVATVVEKNHRFLLVEEICKEELNSAVFNQPAGHLDPNESIFAAAIRETIEETQWRVELRHFIGTYFYKAPSSGVPYLRLCFSAEAMEFLGHKPLDQGIIAAHWLSLPEIRSKQNQLRSPLVIKCIDDYLAGNLYPLSTIYELLD